MGVWYAADFRFGNGHSMRLRARTAHTYADEIRALLERIEVPAEPAAQ